MRSIVNARQLRALCRFALVVSLVAITWLALTPSPPESATLGWDKANHVAAFFVLGCLAFCSMTNQEWQGVLGLIVYGLMLELLQWSGGSRFFEWYDLAANLFGLILCLLCQPVLLRLPPIKAIKSI